ncbi:MAG: MBL fold metallo-hydrolase [Planctomycetes bacterium]|nr:MBL fold metallo-hydrolase [Planctomycetota bacterium]
MRIPTPFVVGPVNAWLVSGGGDHTLVDTGPDTPEARAALDAALAEHGVQLRNLSKIVCTHGHADHCGQANRIAAETGLPLWAHGDERALIEGGQHLEMVLRQREFALARGFPEDLFEKSIAYYSALLHVVSPARIARPLADGDRIPMGGSDFLVIHTPGHTPGSICLLDAADGSIITGDTLLGRITTNAFFRGNDPCEGIGLKAYQASIRRLASLAAGVVSPLSPAGGEGGLRGEGPVREVHPGHGRSFPEFRATLEKLQSHHRERAGHVLAALAAGPKDAFEIVQAIFPRDLPLSEIWLAFADVLGHLEVLEAERAVMAVPRNGRTAYRRCPSPGSAAVL